MNKIETVELQISSYTSESGIHIDWIDGFTINVSIDDGTIVLCADQAGLTSLAKILLTLAQDNVIEGAHIHLDQFNSLEDGSTGLILERG